MLVTVLYCYCKTAASNAQNHNVVLTAGHHSGTKKFLSSQY